MEDLGNVPVVAAAKAKPEGPTNAKYLPQITETCTRLADDGGAGAWTAETFPLVLGGDHSIAVGTVPASPSYFRDRQGESSA